MTTAAEFEAPPQKVTGHPRGLYVLFGSEMWERFSYYGMRALLVLYLVKHLKLRTQGRMPGSSMPRTPGLVYVTPMLGVLSWPTEFLGQRKAILIGGIVMGARAISRTWPLGVAPLAARSGCSSLGMASSSRTSRRWSAISTHRATPGEMGLTRSSIWESTWEPSSPLWPVVPWEKTRTSAGIMDSASRESG